MAARSTMRSNASALCFVVFIAICAGVCDADNFTENHRHRHHHRHQHQNEYQTKQNRLLTFNTHADDNIEIELDFSVPFISIPVKSELGYGAMANLNIGAVALAGMMAFGAAFVVPATYHLFNAKGTFGEHGHKPGGPQSANTNQYGNRYRNDDMFATSSIWKFMSSIDKSLTDHNIDSTSCVQRAICWTVKDSNKRLVMGKATSTDKIVDGLATNSWVSHLVDGSVFQAAIQSGLRGDNCSEEYKQCTIDQETIRRFGKQLMNAVYSRK